MGGQTEDDALETSKRRTSEGARDWRTKKTFITFIIKHFSVTQGCINYN